MKATLITVPASGDKNTVEIDKTGVSVKEFLAHAKVSSSGMNILVNNEPATLATHVPEGANVKLTEKARGS